MTPCHRGARAGARKGDTRVCAEIVGAVHARGNGLREAANIEPESSGDLDAGAAADYFAHVRPQWEAIGAGVYPKSPVLSPPTVSLSLSIPWLPIPFTPFISLGTATFLARSIWRATERLSLMLTVPSRLAGRVSGDFPSPRQSVNQEMQCRRARRKMEKRARAGRSDVENCRTAEETTVTLSGKGLMRAVRADKTKARDQAGSRSESG